jgi:site-specific DNA recombinase
MKRNDGANSLPVGIWIRVSTDDQARGESPKNHEARARMYAEIKGWTIVELYDLSGVSGKSVADHPEAKRMFSDVASGKIKGLIFSKLARLARNTRELLDFSDYFQKHDANLVSLEESLDTSSPAGRLLYTVIGALAQWEREEISARVSASIPIRAQQGKPTGGLGPFGYMWVDRQLVINPAEAPIIRRVFEAFLETGRLLSTCEKLNEEGLRARRGGKFVPVSLKRILTDTAYKGSRRANYSQSLGNKKSWVLKPEKDWVMVPVEPIIDEETWDKVNSRLIKNSDPYPKLIPREGRFLFSGKLFCTCGQKFYVAPYPTMKTPRYTCKACRFKINEDVLIDHFLKALKTMVVHPEELQATIDIESEVEEKTERLEMLRRELKTLDGKIGVLLDLVSDQTLDRGNFAERFLPLKNRKEQLQTEIPRLQGELDADKATRIDKKYLLDRAVNYSEMWPLLNYEEQKMLVEELLGEVRIKDDRIHFVFAFSPSLMEVGKAKRNNRGSSPRRA